ncbi:phytanoyl-CoA dioxygenase family protein [Burkholderia lata]|uniref:phytanoyl-CoA dioxygenase family protein n=1 Tax=Burkholderia lata (strain ATCC 17760 / DSM 23089 / LMG 22485 / NCIMB 9086 / R18194 / 383) TaxID=482957 RepID=UPI001583A2E2|nr:phytanoyl-CoA dioxygenase family protein [Burkholderia lata]
MRAPEGRCRLTCAKQGAGVGLSTVEACFSHERIAQSMSRENAPEITRPCLTDDGQRVRLDEVVALLLSFGPGLHVEDHAFVGRQRPIEVAQDIADAIHARVALEGFAQFTPGDDVRSTLPLAAMRDMVTSLVQAGIPPVFAFVCDEFWLTYWRLHRIIQAALGADTYQLMPDFWVWHVRANAGQAGWSMHRDAGARSLLPDGRAGALSLWIPLTPVDSSTGCVMLLPKHRDPDYGTDRVSQAEFDVRDIRALPGLAGDLMMWSQAVLHWGGRGSPLSDMPRISMSMGVQVDSLGPLNPPLLKSDVLPDAGLRLELIAKQILQYERFASIEPAWAHFARVLLASGLSGLVFDIPDAWRLH